MEREKRENLQRVRALRLVRILYERTDDQRPLTTPKLIKYLAAEGVSAERKSVYRDLAALTKGGYPIAYRPGAGGGWYAAFRPFTLPELQTLVDAVAVYPWLSEVLRQSLTEKLSRLAPRWRREQLNRPVTLPPEGSREGKALRKALSQIYAALREGNALRFAPVVFDPALGGDAAGEDQVISPKGLLWSREGRYYLLAWNHGTGELGLYRPDRMTRVMAADRPAQGPEADPALWMGAWEKEEKT